MNKLPKAREAKERVGKQLKGLEEQSCVELVQTTSTVRSSRSRVSGKVECCLLGATTFDLGSATLE